MHGMQKGVYEPINSTSIYGKIISSLGTESGFLAQQINLKVF